MQTSLLKFTGRVSRICKRDIGVFAPALQKANDPIQQLFLDKLREYKSKAAPGKLVDVSPEEQQTLNNDKQKVLNQYKVKADELLKFPALNFPEPKIETPKV